MKPSPSNHPTEPGAMCDGFADARPSIRNSLKLNKAFLVVLQRCVCFKEALLRLIKKTVE